MKPSIGRIVHYRLTKEEADKTNQRREDAKQQQDQMQRTRPGFQAHIGNYAFEGEIVAMMIVKVWAVPTVNGQAFLDGSDSLWVTNAKEGTGHGEWSWPERT